MAKTITLASLAAQMTKSFGAADRRFAALADDIADIKTRMGTKEDLATVSQRLTGIEGELRSINHRLDIRDIEKRLGLRKKIAA
jgi:hypothetical protein